MFDGLTDASCHYAYKPVTDDDFKCNFHHTITFYRCARESNERTDDRCLLSRGVDNWKLDIASNETIIASIVDIYREI